MKLNLFNSVEIINSTPLNLDHSVGFHDIRPFNQSNNNLVLLHRYPLNTLGFKKKDNITIEICIWDISKNTVEKIDETNAWSWEQGSRLQWINEKELVYNIRYSGKLKSCIYNIEKKTKKILKNTIYSINKNKNFLHINFERLWRLWRSYGYYTPVDLKNYEKQPVDDGVFICDINDKKRIILSINDAVKLCNLENLQKDFFLCHPTFNPSGNKFVSLLRFFNDTGALISYFICTDIENNSSQVLAREQVSHFEWINDEQLVVWCRNLNPKLTKLRLNSFIERKIISNIKKILNLTTSSFKSKILSTNYYLIDLQKSKTITKLNDNLLKEDGHPQVSPNKRYLITDTYANNKKYQKLLLYDFKKNDVHNLGEFKLDDYLSKEGLKYDLHPRWDNTGSLICIDSSHQGSRQTYILNIEKLLKKIN
tara:strand:- start:242 stop:1513 length:1272 start_codon:yes stop_codon:yes gene_type:complete